LSPKEKKKDRPRQSRPKKIKVLNVGSGEKGPRKKEKRKLSHPALSSPRKRPQKKKKNAGRKACRREGPPSEKGRRTGRLLRKKQDRRKGRGKRDIRFSRPFKKKEKGRLLHLKKVGGKGERKMGKNPGGESITPLKETES